MTDEEMAKEYLSTEVPFDTTESGEKLYTEHDMEYAYILALRVGSQLDKVWHDYDAGEDCYEDSHEGRWVKRETIEPQWHDLREDPNDLPEVQQTVQDQDGDRFFYFKGKFYYEDDRFYNCKPVLWCEIPTHEIDKKTI